MGDASNSYARSAQRLSSGLRINTAADDAAGLAESTKLNTNAKVFGRAIQNVNDGISYLNVAQSALTALSSVTERQQELATQASSNTINLSQRQALNAEATALAFEFNRIVQTTQFNGANVLTNTGALNIQAGFATNGTIPIATASALSHNVATGSVASEQDVTTAYDPYNVKATDFNGDGILDLTTAGHGSNALYISLGNADGTFRAATSITASLYGNYSVATGDFDGDGKQDLVTSNYNGGGNAVLFVHGNGDGTFSSPVTIGTVVQGGTIQVGDFNKDGKVDLAVTSDTQHAIAILLSNGNGTFKAAVSYSTGGGAFLNDTQLADIDSDGNLDLVSGGTNGISVLFGNSNGTFRAPIISSTALSVTSVNIADFNGDGISDIVYGGYGPAIVKLGNGDGTFKSALTLSGGSDSKSVTAADLNGDGIADILVSDNAGGKVRFYAGKGDGTFASAVTFASTSNPTQALVADFNGDGASDVALAGGPGFEIFRSASKATTLTPTINLSTTAQAQDSLVTLNAQANRVNGEIGNLAASTSRLTFALSYVSDLHDHLTDAASKITDVDVASEAAKLLRAKILEDTDTALIAQSNQISNLALQLLQF